MKLSFVSEHESSAIKPFDTVEGLPDFLVLTGLNGAGKTHLLRAIDRGYAKVDDVDARDVRYYSYLDFRVQNAKATNESQLKAQQTEAWQFFKGENKKARINVGATSRKVYSQVFESSAPLDDTSAASDVSTDAGVSDLNLWAKLPSQLAEDLKASIRHYRQLLEDRIFRNPTYCQYARHQGVTKTLKRIGKPVHLVYEEDFARHYMPSSEGENYLATSIGNIFTLYKVRQYRHYHDSWEKSEYTATQEELEQTFEERSDKPWELMNALLGIVHRYSNRDEVFNFAITDPGDQVLRGEDVPSYVFLPQLIDKSTGEVRDFGLLSSGEHVLLALAVTIFESTRGFEFPRVLLLDEIDATLHPSMIQALLRTVKEVFVSRGIKVILATHAPTTVALSDETEVFVVNPGPVPNKIEHIPRARAMSMITEGYVTLESGIAIFSEISRYKICILTEGNNTRILARALELFGVTDVEVLSGAEGRTGKDQLKVLYDFFRLLPHQTRALFVLDADVTDEWESESRNTYVLRLPRNTDNRLVTGGIENMFPESLVAPFTKQIIERQGSNERVLQIALDKSKKTPFADFVVLRGTREDFARFSCLKEKIDAIR